MTDKTIEARGHSHGAGRRVATPRGNGPVIIRQAHKAAWDAARVLAHNHMGRLYVLPGGAVIVANSDKRPSWLAKMLA